MNAAPDSLDEARKWDAQDPLSSLRDEFAFPESKSGSPLYFAGHSLGLMPKKAPLYVQEEMEAWARYGVEGHFEGRHPWLPYHENLTAPLARLVGAKEDEVVAMNTLTVNLHLMMASFYRPSARRTKILIEANSFPSDKYAVDSQARYHGLSAKDNVVELKPRAGALTISTEDILEQIHALGDSLALVMLGNCNYLSGQCFDFEKITAAAHAAGAFCGFNLAHGAGNLHLRLHEWGPDFAVWCGYKYLNSGPGGIAGAFVHSRHFKNRDMPRFEGWWGHNKASRFKMGPDFDPLPTVEAWQLSNPPIFQLAAHRASLELFDRAGMKALRARGDRLTGALETLLRRRLSERVQIVTPAKERGSMLCLRFKGSSRDWAHRLRERDIFVDFREPDIIRATPAPLYNSFEDVYRLVEILDELTPSGPT